MTKVFLSFEEAKKIVHTFNLQSYAKWLKFCRDGLKPTNIPSGPVFYYKNKGWISWGDFLGTGRIADKEKKEKLFRPFEDTKKFIKELGIKNETQWRKYLKSGKKPIDIPSDCSKVYKNSGWISWPDFFGLKRKIGNDFIIYDEALKIIHPLKINKKEDWIKFTKLESYPLNIPKNPWGYYKNKGWKSWSEWLGINRISNKNKLFCSYNEAESYVKNFGFKSQSDWKIYCKSGKKPDNIPTSPEKTYKNKGWLSWGHFLGTNRVADQYKKDFFLSFDEAKAFIQKLGFKGETEWREYCKSGKKPANIPSNPEQYYAR